MKFIWILALLSVDGIDRLPKKKKNADDANKPDTANQTIPACVQQRIDSIQKLTEMESSCAGG